MIAQLMKKFWADECGAVVAMEYLMLGSIVAVGGVTGLVSMRDSMNNEMVEFGNSVREVRQAYTPAEVTRMKGKAAADRAGETELVPLSSVTMAP